jgi:hypothetical protein
MDKADNELLSLWRHLHYLQTPMQQHEEGFGNVSLTERGRPFRNTLRFGVSDHVIELGLAHGVEHRQRRDEAAIEVSHDRRGPVWSARYRPSG